LTAAGSAVHSTSEVAPAASLLNESFADAKRRSIEEFERAYIQAALRESGGNISRAAQAMGIARQSLQQKIRELDLKAAADDDEA